MVQTPACPTTLALQGRHCLGLMPASKGGHCEASMRGVHILMKRQSPCMAHNIPLSLLLPIFAHHKMLHTWLLELPCIR